MLENNNQTSDEVAALALHDQIEEVASQATLEAFRAFQGKGMAYLNNQYVVITKFDDSRSLINTPGLNIGGTPRGRPTGGAPGAVLKKRSYQTTKIYRPTAAAAAGLRMLSGIATNVKGNGPGTCH